MRPPAAGCGRPKGAKNKSTILREKLAEQVLASNYQRKYTATEILRRVADGDTSFTAAQIRAAEVLAPFEMPKLQAIVMRTVPPPPPPAAALLAGVPTPLLEVLRDTLAQINEAAGREIEGVVADDDEAC